jgi:hypothetical protein
MGDTEYLYNISSFSKKTRSPISLLLSGEGAEGG